MRARCRNQARCGKGTAPNDARIAPLASYPDLVTLLTQNFAPAAPAADDPALLDSKARWAVAALLPDHFAALACSHALVRLD